MRREWKVMIFSEFAHLHLQGDPAIRFLEIQQSPQNGLLFVEFQLLGFQQPEIFVQDYRPETLSAIERIQNTGQAGIFAEVFNLPAQVNLFAARGNLPAILTLFPSEQFDPQFTLWIASEIGDEIPVYEYSYRHVSPIAPNRFAFLALFEHYPEQPNPIPFPGEIDTQIEMFC